MKIKLNELPEIKDNADIDAEEDFEIFEWSVQTGGTVQKGDKLVEVMAGKTSIEVAVPADGTVTVLVEEGEIVSGDDPIAEIA